MPHVGRSVTFYRPGRRFPSISVTGDDCELNCKHCSGFYLRGMIPAREPDELEEVAEGLAHRGAAGFLLSGGATSSGKVPLVGYAAAIDRIKRSTRLRINAHVGLMPRGELSALVAAGVDAFSVDVYGCDAPIRDTLGLNATAGDYFRVLRDLIDLGAPLVVPHLCVGIHEGRLDGEFAAVDKLSDAGVGTAVMIVLAPTKGTAYADIEAPRTEDILSVIRYARNELTDARLNLGCMRPRSARSLEVEAVFAGVNGIAVPSKATERRLAREGWSIVEEETCCAFS